VREPLLGKVRLVAGKPYPRGRHRLKAMPCVGTDELTRQTGRASHLGRTLNRHSRARWGCARTEPFVRFMIQRLEQAGCKIDKQFINHKECGEVEVLGGFSVKEGVRAQLHPNALARFAPCVPSPRRTALTHARCSGQVVLCRDHITKKQIPTTLTHELIHAYDYCRAKGFDLTNCEHHACTEVSFALRCIVVHCRTLHTTLPLTRGFCVVQIRAANLSRDCWFMAEVNRGHVGLSSSSIVGQGERCVRRRATMSVALNPHCAGVAKEAVDKVYDRCIKDTEPFDRVP
jgi:inner membrane protease ATP23